MLDAILNLDLSDHANYNGGTLLLIVSCLTLSIVTAGWLRDEMRLSRIRWRRMLCVTRTRLLAAWALAGVAIAAGSIIWWPAFPMLIAVERYSWLCASIGASEAGSIDCQLMLSKAQAWASWYTSLAPWPANVANLLVSVASVMASWFVIHGWLGRWSVPVVVMASAAIYAAGAVATELWESLLY